MDVVKSSIPGGWASTMETSTLQETSNLDKAKDRSSSLFSGFAGLFALLLIVVLCALWNWKKWKKRHRPYRRVLGLPSLNQPRPRQRAKNIYDHLPRRQETLGRPQARHARMVSTESLLSRNSSSPASEYAVSPADSVLRVHGAHSPASVYSVGTYDNTLVPQVGENRAPSALDVNGGTSSNCPSTSSEDSLDYANVPSAGEVPETLPSTGSTPESLSAALGARELAFTKERGQEDSWDCSRVWTPGSESSDIDGDSSSQTSNDYVNMEGLEEGTHQGKQPWVEVRLCRDYENIPAAIHHRSQQQQAEEERTSPSTEHMEGRMGESGNHGQLAVQPGRFLALGDQVTHQPAAQCEDNPVKHGEEMLNEDSHDYENVQAVKLRASYQLHPDALRSSHSEGKTCGEIHPITPIVLPGQVKTHDHPCISGDVFGEGQTEWS